MKTVEHLKEQIQELEVIIQSLNYVGLSSMVDKLRPVKINLKQVLMQIEIEENKTELKINDLSEELDETKQKLNLQLLLKDTNKRRLAGFYEEFVKYQTELETRVQTIEKGTVCVVRLEGEINALNNVLGMLEDNFIWD